MRGICIHKRAFGGGEKSFSRPKCTLFLCLLFFKMKGIFIDKRAFRSKKRTLSEAKKRSLSNPKRLFDLLFWKLKGHVHGERKAFQAKKKGIFMHQRQAIYLDQECYWVTSSGNRRRSERV